jgi:hypothetical protein
VTNRKDAEKPPVDDDDLTEVEATGGQSDDHDEGDDDEMEEEEKVDGGNPVLSEDEGQDRPGSQDPGYLDPLGSQDAMEFPMSSSFLADDPPASQPQPFSQARFADIEASVASGTKTTRVQIHGISNSSPGGSPSASSADSGSVGARKSRKR